MALTVDNLARRYRSGFQVGPVSFSVPKGVCFGLIGSNGAGKTTLMRCILGLDQPDTGAARVFERTVSLGVADPRVSGMIEEPVFFRFMSAAENLRAAFPGREEVHPRIPAALEQVGLTDVGRRPVRRFSQGMRQRLGIARVLLADPQVFVFDEPTNGLDPGGIIWFRELLLELTRKGRAIVLSSHLLHEVQQVCSSFLLLEQGRPVRYGSTTDLASFDSLEDVYFYEARAAAND